MDFTHLHLHSEFSLLDGIIRIDKLVDHLKANDMTSCAISDHGVLSGWIDFYKAMKKEELSPLLAMEAYITYDQDGIEDNKDKTKDNLHAVLIAMNQEGYHNLIELNNYAHLHNFYYKPRASLSNLIAKNAGLICLSGCLGGIISRLGVYDEGNKTFDDQHGNCRKQLELFLKVFGDRFYAEIQDLPVWEQRAYNKWLIKQAKDMSIPLVLTTDAHFLTENDYETHRLVMAKNTGKTLDEYTMDEDGLVYQREHHVRTPEAMYKSAINLGVEEAFYNTQEIAKRCNVEITLGEYQYPQFDIESEPDYPAFLEWDKDGCCSKWVNRR